MTITLPEGLTAETKTLSGWGRTNPVTSQVVHSVKIQADKSLLTQES